jgi:hypothetical protein
MAEDTRNQEHTRKYGGSSSFVDSDTPSKAPRQDEQQADSGSHGAAPHAVDPNDERQGISNRPVKEEHAFPDSGPPVTDAAPDSVENTPKQQGGNRGGV